MLYHAQAYAEILKKRKKAPTERSSCWWIPDEEARERIAERVPNEKNIVFLLVIFISMSVSAVSAAAQNAPKETQGEFWKFRSRSQFEIFKAWNMAVLRGMRKHLDFTGFSKEIHVPGTDRFDGKAQFFFSGVQIRYKEQHPGGTPSETRNN